MFWIKLRHLNIFLLILGDIEDNILVNFMAMYDILRAKTILSILIAVICIGKLCHDITYILVFFVFICLVFYFTWIGDGK